MGASTAATIFASTRRSARLVVSGAPSRATKAVLADEIYDSAAIVNQVDAAG